MSARVLLVVAAFALATSGAARADEPTGPSLFKRGVEALRAQDYATAAAAFQQSYALQPRAATVCNLALTYDRWAGHVGDAIEAYRKCAEDDESGRFRDHALERARQLREQLAATPPPVAPKPEPEVAPPVEKPAPPVEKAAPPVEKPAPPVEEPAPAVERPAPASRPFFHDAAAVTLTALGVAGVAVGVGLVVDGKLADDSVATTVDLGQKTTLYNRAGVFLPAGYISLGVGAALVIAGVVEWAVHGRHRAPTRAAARAAWSF